MTVLFCDVAGSTALGESLDAEALLARLVRYCERMQAIVERHGGVVEKFVGDAGGLRAAGGARGRRSARAPRAAEMQAALPELQHALALYERKGSLVMAECTRSRLAALTVAG